MKSKVFVSCGQANDQERRTAEKIRSMLVRRGFQPYLAIQAQTIKDINGGIIHELKNSDYYLFVNFRRERLPRARKGQPREYRGSLFSNQEFAIAYALNFERFLIVNQNGIKSEGMLRYVGLNTKGFRNHRDCVAAIEAAVLKAKWEPTYSRRLQVSGLAFVPNVTYRSVVGETLHGYFLYMSIHNGRPDIAAIEATARLAEYGTKGRALRPSHILSPLKASGRPGFAHTIFPKSEEQFDLLCVGTLYGAFGVNKGVFLNSALDAPWTSLSISPGDWMLRYEFLAIDFPLLSVTIELTVPNAGNPTARLVRQELL